MCLLHTNSFGIHWISITFLGSIQLYPYTKQIHFLPTSKYNGYRRITTADTKIANFPLFFENCCSEQHFIGNRSLQCTAKTTTCECEQKKMKRIDFFHTIRLNQFTGVACTRTIWKCNESEIWNERILFSGIFFFSFRVAVYTKKKLNRKSKELVRSRSIPFY